MTRIIITYENANFYKGSLLMGAQSMQEEALATMAGVPMFQGISAEERAQLSAAAEVLTVERGATIWLNGAHVDFFGLVASGFVKMVKGAPTGQEVTAEILGPGQVFGLLGAVDGKGCPLMARSVTKTRFVKVPKGAFARLYHANTSVKDQVVRRSTLRLRQAFNAMALLSTGTVEQRLAAVLFTLAETYGEETPAGLRIEVPLTRQDMADLAGTTVETTIRVLSRWQAQNLVATEQRRITLRDEPALSALLAG